MRGHPVIDALAGELRRGARQRFLADLRERLHQLDVGMVDGRVLPGDDAAALFEALLEFLRHDALPRLTPGEALGVLDLLHLYGRDGLEDERATYVRARASRYPAPAPLTWPEVEAVLAAGRARPELCQVAAPAGDASFAEALRAQGAPLPDAVVALSATCDGFDLQCAADPRIPVFAFLGSAGFDATEAQGGYPWRAEVCQGGDEVALSVYRDRRRRWWLVLEIGGEAVARRPFDLRDLLRFAVARMEAPTLDALDAGLSWQTYFEGP